MNLLTIETRLARRRGADTTLVTATKARYADAINEAHRALLRMPGMESLRYGLITFATVASTQQYALPTQGIARVNTIRDTVNRRKLEYKTLPWYREAIPVSYNGLPWAWIPIGFVEVATQPSAADSVWVKSTASGDTTQTAFVEGITAGGFYRTASVTLTGVTAVQLGTIADFVQITKFYLSAAAAGTVTLIQTSGAGTVLAQIAIADVRAQYYSFLLEYTPSAIVTYTCDVLRAIPDMSNDTDEPLLPEDFHDLLIDGAELRELRKQDDPQRWQLVKAAYDGGVKDLKNFVNNHPDWRPQWGGAPAGISTLGGQFSADTVVR